ncbi:MAG TPA: Smr/MutS family protein, partial [Gemmatimonadales bacterium]
IGDRQSIAASLSTFSAHVAMLRRILAEADASALVLLDEVGSGTDPAEGAALAAAILASLTDRGALTLATTHLGALKDLASHTPGVVNASLQFDAATLTPTYLFEKGVPGRSYGLAIARRLGLGAEILADAEARVPDAERNLDALLAAAEERGREARETQARLEQREAELASLGVRLAAQEESQRAREAELKRLEKEADRAGRRQARQYLMDARKLVEEALGAARAAGTAADEEAAREARRMVELGIGEHAEVGERDDEPAPGAEAPAIAVKARVRLPSGGTGEVLELRDDGTAVVTAGAMKIVLEASTLTPLPPRGRDPSRREARPAGMLPPADPAGAALEVDLRGLTGDEAEQATIAAVDAAVLAEQPLLRIIHGMGTGVVRDRVRRVVSGDRRVARFGFAPRNQGGTGVTIVEFSA